ncbi:hypothetical protein CTEN210_18042 [Chaetoceros tenuissimus]|uniref:Right handed beta helix domain-containing protein n=1 Tax=Chaetoceros tenuissimus TaxID=426638 RepID=A0AAD3DE17_9STRA|nr:hypothetical protein CTEN210_18042 [Chaetoceros tenuissimus]
MKLISFLLFTYSIDKSFTNARRLQSNGNNNGNGKNVFKEEMSTVEGEDVTCLFNEDFELGTLIIDEPGKYKLCEDIVFDPIQDKALPVTEMYLPDFNVYNENAYGMGFFAAIAISASNVEIYLNNHSIEQSASHALMQRFFAIIELANSPFLQSVGPAQFVGENGFQAASNILIQGPGKIGRSAHHGVHGNENQNITIRDVTFQDFEVAAVALNNVDNAIIEHNTILNNRHDVPVIGSFSAAAQISHYGKALKAMNFGMNLKGVFTTAEEVYNSLLAMIENTYFVVSRNKDSTFFEKKFPEEYFLFHNKNQVVDGPCYAFVIHGKGPAVGGFGFELAESTKMSSNIQISDNTIDNIKCWENEVPALIVDGVVQNDARGAMLQLIKSTSEDKFLAINDDGTYKRNPVADMQIMTAAAIQQGLLVDDPLLQTVVNTISPSIVEWASSSNNILTPHYRCNGDSMHHTIKGMNIIRVEDCEGFTISGNSINNIQNLSDEPFDNCSSYHLGASIEDTSTQVGSVRVISLAAVTGYVTGSQAKSQIAQNDLSNITGQIIIGIDIQGKSDSCFIDSNVFDESFLPRDNVEKSIAIRLREFVDSSVDGSQAIEIGPNNNIDETQIEMFNGSTDSEHMRKLAELHKKMNIGIEWKLGACPFGRR